MTSLNTYTARFILFLPLVLVSSAVFSQQIPKYTMQELVRPGINPAYVGSEGISDVVLLTRQQWLGFEGAPQSFYLAASVPLRNPNTGVGIDFQCQSTGPFTQNGIFLSYSYTIGISENSALSFGLRGGFSAYRILLSDLSTIDPGDPLFETSVTNRILPNFGTGLHYTFRNYYFDLSIPLLLRNELSPDRNDNMSLQNREDRVYNLQTGAEYDLADGISIQPALAVWLLKEAPPLLDVRLSATFLDAVSVGITYRVTGALGAYFTYRVFETFLLGYAYELPLAYDYHLTTGTHELVLGFNFHFLKMKTSSPRKF